jgi:NAD(P)-dependent dehydrogenase (short-subunit alcohol dehydrogenase family)
MGRVAGKVAIVTGAGSTPGPGIGTGKASAIVLAREGARVLLVDLYPERAAETLEIIENEGGKAVVFGADVTTADGCEAMIRAATDAFGTVDILLNNVGRASLGTVVDTSEQAWDQAMDINLRSAFLASKYAVPVMAAKGGGSVVNVASISALRGDGTVAYSAAKGGLIAMTIDMAYSHGRQGIRVNAIAPGHITTPMVMSVSAPRTARRVHEHDAGRGSGVAKASSSHAPLPGTWTCMSRLRPVAGDCRTTWSAGPARSCSSVIVAAAFSARAASALATAPGGAGSAWGGGIRVISREAGTVTGPARMRDR